MYITVFQHISLYFTVFQCISLYFNILQIIVLYTISFFHPLISIKKVKFAQNFIV